MAQDQTKVVRPTTNIDDTSSETDGEPRVMPSLSMSLADQKPNIASPPPLPKTKDKETDKTPEAAQTGNKETSDNDAAVARDNEAPQRRIARRRPAGPVKGTIAANDDAPSIGGLIYALEQKPSNRPFVFAAIASAVWGLAGLSFAAVMTWQDIGLGKSLLGILAQPSTFFTITAIVVPIAILWFLALLAWRSEELRLRSSTMAEVAVRLAEPDRMAEQSVASLGQAVRRQVAFMNDAVSRALGRAGELEALVHNEVSALENSYEDNERKIRGLIQELSGERNALANTSDRVAGTLRQLGSEVPSLIEKLSHQQIRLAQIIQQAGDNLTTLESSIGSNVNKLETSLGGRTEELQVLLEGYTTGLATALGNRSEQMREAFDEYLKSLDTSLGERTNTLQTVFEEYARALDTTLANRAKTLDIQLIERTKALDLAFNERLQLFDNSIKHSTTAIDQAVGQRAAALTSALDNHAKTFKQDITRQSTELDESLTQGISAVRRTSENITRQSLKAIEGLSGQSEMLKNVSENLLGQINTVTGRFENQSQSIMKAANSLESANYKIDVTLKARHSDLSQTLDQLTGKADEFGRFVQGYSSTIEGSLSDAEQRARAVTEQLLVGTEQSKSKALADLDRLKRKSDAQHRDQNVRELHNEFARLNSAVEAELGSLRNRFSDTTDDVRQQAGQFAREIATEQERLREEMQRRPNASREDADSIRRAMQKQVRALERLNNLAASAPRGPAGGVSTGPSSLTGAYEGAASTAAQRGGRPPGPGQARPRPGRSAAVANEGDNWSVGDLLARASQDDQRSAAGAPASGSMSDDFKLNIQAMSNALDPTTAESIWARLRSGQPNVMSRAFYSAEGQILFDQFATRLQSDSTLQQTVDRFLVDFDRIRRETEANDPSGAMSKSQLLSDTGRVYLFLAHARGRIQ